MEHCLSSFLLSSISNPPLVDWTNGFHSVPFLSHMLSLLDFTATAQLCYSTILMFHYCSTSLSCFLIGQLLFLVTISLLDDSVSSYITWSMCCPCIVYKPPSPVSCSSASSTQFSLVSSFQGLPWDHLIWSLPLHGTALLGHCNSLWDPS